MKTQFIHVNQLGYRPKDRKVAVINGNAGTVKVVEEESGKTVFSGHTTHSAMDDASGDMVCHVDFSQVTCPGRYHILVPGSGKSYSFPVGENVYRDLKGALLKALYYQRCGMALKEEFAGPWKHGCCHMAKACLLENPEVELDTSGGWHDAGDYGKYTVAAANAVAELLLAYELFPHSFSQPIHIPESGNGWPDLLNEAKYELDWLFSMQDDETGGAYHKVAALEFPPFIMPEEDLGKQYVNEVSATATGDFAAVMAMAARVFKNMDGGFAKRALSAAEKAWKWLEANRCYPGFKNPEGVCSGEYGDDNNEDERYWAAVELYRVTGCEIYHDYIRKVYRQGTFDLFGMGWVDIGGLGTVSYLLMEEDKRDPGVYPYLKREFTDRADRYVSVCSKDGYRISLFPDQYVWGSTMVMMNNAVHLIIANWLNPKPEYTDAALNHLHYLLGCNPLSQCYVTGYGSKPIQNPHHRPSAADGVDEPVPGMVSGGPDYKLQDPVAEAMLGKDILPARAFIDHVDSYATNEITIYWNASAIFVAGFFDEERE